MKSLPEDVVCYQRTKEFSEHSVPAGLLRSHTTKSGTWGRICVLEGRLRYRILGPEPEDHVLTPEHHGVVEPEVPHEVEPSRRLQVLIPIRRFEISTFPDTNQSSTKSEYPMGLPPSSFCNEA